MATAPATGAPADALIMALRGATPMQGQASTLKFYDNPENSVYTLLLLRLLRPRRGLQLFSQKARSSR